MCYTKVMVDREGVVYMSVIPALRRQREGGT
jgi:hypothetical protein